MKYPTATLKGVECDIYDIANAFEVTSPPLFNAVKKIIRRGNGAKTERQDLEEAIESIRRHLRDVPNEPIQPRKAGDGKRCARCNASLHETEKTHGCIMCAANTISATASMP